MPNDPFFAGFTNGFPIFADRPVGDAYWSRAIPYLRALAATGHTGAQKTLADLTTLRQTLAQQAQAQAVSASGKRKGDGEVESEHEAKRASYAGLGVGHAGSSRATAPLLVASTPAPAAMVPATQTANFGDMLWQQAAVVHGIQGYEVEIAAASAQQISTPLPPTQAFDDGRLDGHAAAGHNGTSRMVTNTTGADQQQAADMEENEDDDGDFDSLFEEAPSPPPEAQDSEGGGQAVAANDGAEYAPPGDGNGALLGEEHPPATQTEAMGNLDDAALAVLEAFPDDFDWSAVFAV